jgi:hypothetical protein
VTRPCRATTDAPSVLRRGVVRTVDTRTTLPLATCAERATRSNTLPTTTRPARVAMGLARARHLPEVLRCAVPRETRRAWHGKFSSPWGRSDAGPILDATCSQKLVRSSTAKLRSPGDNRAVAGLDRMTSQSARNRHRQYQRRDRSSRFCYAWQFAKLHPHGVLERDKLPPAMAHTNAISAKVRSWPSIQVGTWTFYVGRIEAYSGSQPADED